MKVFISWSGPISKRLAEAIRDWLPSVIQAVKPYFTPADIEKGSRWSSEIAKELETSEFGLICVTRDNVHSDWVLFEAGALSKSLATSRVCPILFGVRNADLSGPLKQFQTTEFDKEDIQKLVSSVNAGLENRLPPKTLDNVFEKWWPELESQIDEILKEIPEPEGPLRADREILEEILSLSRASSRRQSLQRTGNPAALSDLLTHFISLHDEEMHQIGDHQHTLNSLKKLEKAIKYYCRPLEGSSEELDALIATFKRLSYEVSTDNEETDDDLPF